MAAILSERKISAQEVADSVAGSASTDVLLKKAETFMKSYDFLKAVECCEEAEKAAKDSLAEIKAEEMLLMAQNGLSMTGYCSTPVVVANNVFSISDFFLFYPLKDNSWRKTPNQLDSLGRGIFPAATYVEDGKNTLYYSAKDENGIRNIYKTSLKDTVWTVPELLNEQLTSSSDEIFPMLSDDGQHLYFSSRGLYGMGGYDLYVSDWDSETGDWSAPVNMGFPFSSPYDDFLYINTDDGKYSIFASNRDCAADSVRVYVLEYDSTPVRKAITDAETLRKLATLNAIDDPSRVDTGHAVGFETQEDAETKKYIGQMSKVKTLRDSISTMSDNLDKARARYATEQDAAERQRITQEIMDGEMLIPTIQDSLNAALKALQQIEMDFLISGSLPDIENLRKEADREIVGAASGYTFSRRNFGPDPDMQIEKPKPSFDYTLMILKEGRFAEDNTLPEGLVYQIQIFSIGGKATVKQLKGLSPVFERTSGGRHTYSAGLFRSYKDVLANLNKVKSAGFRSAMIVAFKDGSQITVEKARQLEKKIKQTYTIRIYPSGGNSLSEAEVSIIRQIADKDIIRSSDNGVISFLFGPFDDKDSAEEAARKMKDAGTENISVEALKP